jgi:ribosomal protein L37E
VSERSYYRCRRCGQLFHHINKYSSCDSPGCDGEEADEVRLTEYYRKRLEFRPEKVYEELESSVRSIASRIGPARLPESIKDELIALANQLRLWAR